jgi:hypothetical protein
MPAFMALLLFCAISLSYRYSLNLSKADKAFVKQY